MSNEITNVNTFRVVRVVGKNNKETYRNLLGVIASGNKCERELALRELAMACWENNNYAPLSAEVKRVFGTAQRLKGAEFIGFDFDNPKREGFVKFLEALVRENDVKEFKGEKATWMVVVRAALKAEAEKVARITDEQRIAQSLAA